MLFNLFQHCMKFVGKEDEADEDHIFKIDGLIITDAKTDSTEKTPDYVTEETHRLFDIVSSSDGDDEIWVPDIASSEDDYDYVPPLARTLFSNGAYDDSVHRLENKKMGLDDEKTAQSDEHENADATTTEEEQSKYQDHVPVPCEESISEDKPEATADDEKMPKEEPEHVNADEDIPSEVAHDLKDDDATKELDAPMETPHISHAANEENVVPIIMSSKEPQQQQQQQESKVDHNHHYDDGDSINDISFLFDKNDRPEHKVVVTDGSIIVITQDKVLVAKKPTTPGEKAQFVEMKRKPTKKRKSKRSSARRSSNNMRNNNSATATMLSPNKVILMESQSKTLLGAMQH
jgi:hypothetical protein